MLASTHLLIQHRLQREAASERHLREHLFGRVAQQLQQQRVEDLDAAHGVPRNARLRDVRHWLVPRRVHLASD